MKTSPRILAAIATLTLSSAIAGAQGLPGYAPSKVTYRVNNTVATMQNMMGNVQMSEATSNQLITIALTKDASGLKLVMSLDSSTATTNNPMAPAPDMSELIGMTLSGPMTPDGKVEKFDVAMKGGAAATSPLAAGFRPLLPKLKVGAKIGESWDDSTTSTQKQNGADVQTINKTTATYSGDTTVAGAKAHKITVTSTAKIAGSGNQMGADFSLNGTSKSTSIVLLGADGVLIGLTSDGASDVTVDVPQASMTIPMQMKNTTTVGKKN